VPVSSNGGAGTVNLKGIGVCSPKSCDVNNDGVVNISDLQLVINQVLGTAPATSDINGDCVVNGVDVQIVKNAILGLGGCN
jgi:hypothetical protein